jgi:membrane-associated protease RseP (regulator of RpoE activity)
MFLTLVNLIPAGQFDGGHAVRGLLGRKTNMILPILAIAVLLVANFQLYFIMAILAIFFSRQKHPGPLDDASPLTTSRKAASILLIVMFILCIAPVTPIF